MIFYLDDKVIVGVLLLNVFGPGIEIARKLIADGREHDDFRQVSLYLLNFGSSYPAVPFFLT